MSTIAASGPSVAIIGAGIIGLSCAWELSRRGAKVTVYEKNWPPRGASWAAAGMLAPAYEAAAEEGAHPQLFDLCMAGAELWAEFAAELEAASGMEVGYHSGPTLAVAVDADQARRIVELREALDERGVPYERLTPDKARTLEPTLSNDVIAAMSLPTDGWVDNRRVLGALARLNANAIKAVETGDLEITAAGDVTKTDVRHDLTLLCGGAYLKECLYWTESGSDRPNYFDEIYSIGLQSVEGRIVAFASSDLKISRTIRAGSEYAVPRRDQTVFGATVGETVTPDVLLQGSASRIFRDLPPILDSWAGFRPRLIDHAPALGRVAPSTFIATGHYRNGILLAPITAKIMADMILNDSVSDLAAAFSPDRFAETAD